MLVSFSAKQRQMLALSLLCLFSWVFMQNLPLTTDIRARQWWAGANGNVPGPAVSCAFTDVFACTKIVSNAVKMPQTDCISFESPGGIWQGEEIAQFPECCCCCIWSATQGVGMQQVWACLNWVIRQRGQEGVCSSFCLCRLLRTVDHCCSEPHAHRISCASLKDRMSLLRSCGLKYLWRNVGTLQIYLNHAKFPGLLLHLLSLSKTQEQLRRYCSGCCWRWGAQSASVLKQSHGQM